MRTIKFVISGQSIKKDPSCDFSGIVPGTSGYLRAEFTFDAEWNGCGKIAEFWRLGKKYQEKIVDNTCMIPAEALTYRIFQVSIVGVRPGGYRIQTGKAEVRQDG